VRRWLIALLALAMGGGVSAALLVFANPDRETVDVYVASRDIPAGSPIASGAFTLVRLPASSLTPLLFRRGEAAKLAGLRATHDLLSGQLIQRSDATSQENVADRRLVLVPLKDAPPAAAGSKVDLLIVAGPPDHLSVAPFAIGVEVRASVAGGLVVAVSSRQAPAFVYAANAMRLTAVIADPSAAAGVEGAVSTLEQAIAVAAQP
jgi:hypothetical protein